MKNERERVKRWRLKEERRRRRRVRTKERTLELTRLNFTPASEAYHRR